MDAVGDLPKAPKSAGMFDTSRASWLRCFKTLKTQLAGGQRRNLRLLRTVRRALASSRDKAMSTQVAGTTQQRASQKQISAVRGHIGALWVSYEYQIWRGSCDNAGIPCSVTEMISEIASPSLK
jgi:hypothetical protein